jgi:hypothetical protein
MHVMLTADNQLAEAYLRYVDDFRSSDKYDLMIDQKDVTPEIVDQYKRILMIERCDSATIGHARRWLAHPHVKTLLKMYYYDDLELNNRRLIDGRQFITEGESRDQWPRLTVFYMAKVRCGLNFFHYRKLEPAIARSANVNTSARRRYRWTFAGTIDYTEKCSGSEKRDAAVWLTRHRLKFLSQMRAQYGDGKIIHGRQLNSTQYLDMLEQSEYAPSPFGWGEYCHRDYEAILMGCRVVKPDMHHSIRDVHGLAQLGFRVTSRWLAEQKSQERQIILDILA